MGHGEPFTETKELLPAGPSCLEGLDATEPLELPLSSWVHRAKLFPIVHLHRPHLFQDLADGDPLPIQNLRYDFQPPKAAGSIDPSPVGEKKASGSKSAPECLSCPWPWTLRLQRKILNCLSLMFVILQR